MPSTYKTVKPDSVLVPGDLWTDILNVLDKHAFHDPHTHAVLEAVARHFDPEPEI